MVMHVAVVVLVMHGSMTCVSWGCAVAASIASGMGAGPELS
jgi:hypothetical protein